MKTTTIKENNNTMQFRPDKVDCTYIKEHSMIKLNSFYFSSSTVKFFNSKIKRVLFVHKDFSPQNFQQSAVVSTPSSQRNSDVFYVIF